MIDEDRANLYHDSVAMLILRSQAYAMFSDFLQGASLENMDEGVAATDGRKFYIGPLFKNYTAEERAFIIAHELNHVLLRHPWRGVDKDDNLYNVAGDYVINDTLHLIDLPDFPLPGTPITLKDLLSSNKAKQESEDMKGIMYDETLKDMDTDSIYRMLLNERDKRMMKQFGKIATGEGRPGPESEAGKVDRGMIGKLGEGNINGGDVVPNPDKDSEDDTVKNIANSIRKYQETHSAGSGTENGAVRRILELLNMHETLPWTTIIQRYLKNLVASNYSWSPPKAIYYPPGTIREYPNTYVPRLRERSIKIAIAVDTSGSIGDADLAQFIDNLRALLGAILQQVGYSGVFMLATDEVYWYKALPPLPSVKDIVENEKTGGTDFKPVFKFVDERSRAPPDVFIYFTDGYGDYPETPPKYDVIWVLTPESEAKPPFGQVIRFSV